MLNHIFSRYIDIFRHKIGVKVANPELPQPPKSPELAHPTLPVKILNVIMLTYEGLKASVLHEGAISKEFEMRTGLKQSRLLSSLLFLVVLD